MGDSTFASPHDVAAEHAVLAVLLLDPCRIAEVTAAQEPDDFEDEANRTIYAAMLHLHFPGKPHSVSPEHFELF